MNTTLHAVADANGRPLGFLTATRASNHTGAAALLDDKSADEPTGYDRRRYRRRSRIEIMFGRLEDWRRVAARCDRRPTAFFSAIALAATGIFRP